MKSTRFAIATNCTNRKRIAASRALECRNLPRGPAGALASEWAVRIKSADVITSATSLYQGRAFVEAKAAARVLDADLYIVSAGLGLFNAKRNIPSYNLTITEKSANNVLRRCTEPLSAEDWWQFLNTSLETQTLSSRIRRSNHEYWLIAVPSTYYGMVRRDLSQLRESDLDRVRLFGPRPSVSPDPVLKRCLISIDDRLDGPDSIMPGTRIDFAQRAMMFFIENVISALPNGDIGAHRNATKRILNKMAWPEHVPRRAPATDAAICKKLDQFWRKGNGQSTKLLRIFRDELAIACEEGRFRRLFHVVARQRGVE